MRNPKKHQNTPKQTPATPVSHLSPFRPIQLRTLGKPHFPPVKSKVPMVGLEPTRRLPASGF